MYTTREKLPYMMTVQEMAELMRISTWKAYQLVKVEGCPSIVLGSRIIIPRDAFLAWIEGRKIK